MNQIILIGRLTRDPEVKTTQGGTEVCSFTVAVDRKFKSASGEREADFINCVAWKQRATLIGQYFSKGSKIGIVGNLQTRKYQDKDDRTVYVSEVIVDEVEFIDKKDEKREEPKQVYQPIEEDDAALPFDL